MDPNDSGAAKNPQLLRPCNKAQLAELLGVSRYILNCWINGLKEKLGPINGKTLSAKQVRLLVDTYGLAADLKNLKRG